MFKNYKTFAPEFLIIHLFKIEYSVVQQGAVRNDFVFKAKKNPDYLMG